MLETRILQVFAKSNLSRIEFAEKLNISNAVLSHISSGRNKAGMDLVMGVLTHFPEINPDWLLLGNGEMLRQDNNMRWQSLKLELLNEMQQLKSANQLLADKLQDFEKKITALE